MSDLGGSVRELAEAFISERTRRKEWGTLRARNARSTLFAFAHHAGNDSAMITRRRCEAWYETLEHLAPSTRRGKLGVVRAFTRWLALNNLLDSDPVSELRSPRQPRSVPRAMPTESVHRLIDVCPDSRARLICLLMVQLGLRCAEVATLQTGDIDRVRGTVRVLGKGDHERILPVVPDVDNAIDDYLLDEPQTSAGPLIRSRSELLRGVRADTISKLVAGWMYDAGIKRRSRDGVSGHALRHTAATDALINGAHIRDVQKALGHAHLATTEIYLAHEIRGLGDALGGRHYGTRYS